MKGTDPTLMAAAARRAALEAPTVILAPEPPDPEEKTGPTIVVPPELRTRRAPNWLGWLPILLPFLFMVCR